MAEDRPNAEELIETVREFLHDKLLPTMSGHDAFEVRIAANLLAIALRYVLEAADEIGLGHVDPPMAGSGPASDAEVGVLPSR